MADLLTDREFFSAKPTPAAPALQPQSNLLTDKEFLGPTKTQQLLEGLKGAGGETAAVADLLWNTVTMPLGVGADIGARAYATGAGETPKLAAQAGRIASEQIGGALQSPVKKFLDIFESGEAYEKSKTTAGMSWLAKKIENFGDYLEKQTGGTVKSEDVASLADTLMSSLGVRGAEAMRTAKRPPKQDRLSAGDFRNEKPRLKLTDQGPRPVEELQQIHETAKAREATLNDEVTKPPKPRIKAKGEADPEFLLWTTTAAASGIAAEQLYERYQQQKAQGEQKEEEPQPTERGTFLSKVPEWLVGGAMLAGAVKGKGGRAGPSVGRAVLSATRTAIDGKGLTAAAKELVPGPISAALAADPRIRIKGEMDNTEIYARREELVRNRLVNDTLAEVKQPTRREAISHWLEGNKAFVLSSTERAAAERIRKWFADVGHQAQKWGVLGNLLDNYVTHVFGKEAKSYLDQLMAARKTGAISSGFAMQRTGSPTIAEVNAWMKSKGQEPITADIAPIIEAYGNSMTKAISNRMLVENLKGRTASFDQGGQKVTRPLVIQSWKAPRNYVPFGSAGLAAHPDIIGPLRFAFDADSTISAVRAIEAVNTAAKRSAVSFSLFHAKALLDAFAGATTLSAKNIAAGAAVGAGTALVLNDDPITYGMIGAGLGMAAKGGKLVAQAGLPKVFGENRFIKALRKNDPSLAKMIDLSFEGGLMYTLRRGELADQELGGRATSFYAGLKWAQQGLDKILPGAGMAIKGVEKLNHAVDGFMWERLHTAMKLEVFAEKYETLLEGNAKAHRANSKVKLFSEKELAERAASFTNDIFGGLNWRRIAEETHTKWGRDLAMGIYGPSGRRMLRIGMFAPDWTISTTRAAIKALGPVVGQESGTGVRGLLNPSTMTDLHWQYMLRSAFYYAMVGDGLNVALNGKHLWEEDDPTYIHMRDGRKIQYSKHTLEPYHWLQHPVQQGLNKLGQIPKEGLNQIFGTEYLNPRVQGGNVTAGPTMKEGRLRHAAQSVSPIGVQQLAGGGAAAGAMGAVGMPVYGKTNEERRKERFERQLETRKKRERRRMLQGK